MDVCKLKVHSRSLITLLLSSWYCSCLAWGLLFLEIGILLGVLC
jgi:hypothetical protein